MVSAITDKGDGTYTAIYTSPQQVDEETKVKLTVPIADKSASTDLILTRVVPPSQATFVLSALKTELAALAGGFPTYLIKLKGENGFAGTVTLFTTDDLPAKVEATFAPKTVTLSAAAPLTDSQLTLTLPAESPPGVYPFTVLAVPASGETQRLTLTLRIESKPIFNTSLSLVLPKATVRFMEPLDVRGELLSDDASAEVGNAIIQITFVAPGGKIQTFETQTDREKSYQLETPFLPDAVGTWTVKARFDGSARLKSSERERTFTVIKGSAEIRFSTGPTGALGDEVELIGTLSPPLKGQPLSLKLLRPDGSASTLTDIITEDAGVFRHKVKFDKPGNWEFTVTWAGNATYESGSQTLKIAVSAEVGKAIIVLGGGDRQNNKDWDRFNGLAEYVRAIPLKRQFNDAEDIHFLSPDPTRTKGADTETSLNNLQLAITTWAKARVNPQVPLYLYLLSHNLGNQFLLTKRPNDETFLSPALLNEWLSQLPTGTPVTIIVEACYSGNFISGSGSQPSPLVGPNRTLFVSARGDKQAKILTNLSSFSKIFFDRIAANKTIAEAFQEAQAQMEHAPLHREQLPQMDANGNGLPNEPQDLVALAKSYLPADLVSLGKPPEFIKLTPPMTLAHGISSLRLEAELLGTNISRAFATVIPPTFDPTRTIDDWGKLTFDEFDLAKVSEGKFAAAYANFTLPGDYTVIVNAENPDGSAASVQTTITVPQSKPAMPWDVNGDGTVNVLDLVLVSSQFGQVGAGLPGDVNGDGVVNILDLVLVGSHFGETTAAAAPFSPSPLVGEGRGEGKVRWQRPEIPLTLPLSHGGARELIPAERLKPLRQALAALEAKPNLSHAEMVVRNFLRSWLADVAPLVTETKLLPNYPNPFNPETWMPYQLAKDAEVRITIYDLNGALVRQLELGYQAVGFYTEPSRAAYWDGRNAFGESVSSGVYFYRMVAGDYAATRRMVILK